MRRANWMAFLLLAAVASVSQAQSITTSNETHTKQTISTNPVKIHYTVQFTLSVTGHVPGTPCGIGLLDFNAAWVVGPNASMTQYVGTTGDIYGNITLVADTRPSPNAAVQTPEKIVITIIPFLPYTKTLPFPTAN